MEREEILRAMDEAAVEYVELLDFAIVPLRQTTKAWDEPIVYRTHGENWPIGLTSSRRRMNLPNNRLSYRKRVK